MGEAAPELRPGWAETETLLLLRRLLDRGTAVHRLVARNAGLGDHEMTALEAISRTPMGPAELARLLDVTAPAATGIVDRLVARGHAERRPHAADRRRTEVHVTDSGRAEVRAHLLPMFLTLARVDGEFDEAERTVVARYLRGAVEAFEAVAGPAPH
ncbi:MarR family winged helix-turn-helix transcriptional regulator [Nocardioides sp. CPCC 205120]|uniref:MarR family winged helix-turn-helix transcriptional regulator n=1 Tax=Nocardioides sp. CPCC 205120 TaxID=3406462 RepID=UPI003B51453D